MRYVKITMTLTSMSLTLAVATPLWAMGNSDPFLSGLKINQFEIRDAENNHPVVFDGEFWAGHDLDRFLLKADLEYTDSQFTEMQWQALYSKGISAYWNMQTGLRYDEMPDYNQAWGVFGFAGVAPYFIDTDVSFAVGESGQTALEIETEHELLITQRLILIPELKATAYGQTFEKYQQGQGLADFELGLRLAYGIRRELRPYAGILWHNTYGETKAFRGEEPGWQFVLGVNGWL